MEVTDQYWGYHLILDCSDCNYTSISSYDNIYNFTKQLVEDIKMTAYGEPQIVHFGPEGKKGYTLVQLIETSNICCHFVECTDSMYLDVFSCKPYDSQIVIDLVKKYFEPKKIRKMFLTRQAN